MPPLPLPLALPSVLGKASLLSLASIKDTAAVIARRGHPGLWESKCNLSNYVI